MPWEKIWRGNRPQVAWICSYENTNIFLNVFDSIDSSVVIVPFPSLFYDCLFFVFCDTAIQYRNLLAFEIRAREAVNKNIYRCRERGSKLKYRGRSANYMHDENAQYQECVGCRPINIEKLRLMELTFKQIFMCTKPRNGAVLFAFEQKFVHLFVKRVCCCGAFWSSTETPLRQKVGREKLGNEDYLGVDDYIALCLTYSFVLYISKVHELCMHHSAVIVVYPVSI